MELNGFEYARTVAIGRAVDLASRTDVRELLVAEGEIVFADVVPRIAQAGDIGFAEE